MKNKGVTLIALVITIIILLILAGVVWHILNETGLIEKATVAKTETENAQEVEGKALNNYALAISEANNNKSSDDNSGEDDNKPSTGTQKDLLWSGKYNTAVNSVGKQETGGCTLNGNYNIEDYEYVLVLVAIELGGSSVPEYYTKIFPVDIIKQNYGYPTIETSTFANAQYFSRINLGFINNNTFYVAYQNLAGWPSHYRI